MDDPHTESQLLREIWLELNALCFASALTEPNSIGWIDFSKEGDIKEEFGYYFTRLNGIALSHRFQYAEDQHLQCLQLSSDPTLTVQKKKEALIKFNAYEIVYLLMVHEMIHQAAHQAGDSHANHGESFLKHASGAATALGIPAPTLDEAPQWPDIRNYLALEFNAGNIRF